MYLIRKKLLDNLLIFISPKVINWAVKNPYYIISYLSKGKKLQVTSIFSLCVEETF